jgi:hypothetical protein
MNMEKLAIGFATVYLLTYVLLLQFSQYFMIGILLFSLSPLVLAGLVFIVLKYGKYSGNDLNEGEEWGYADRDKDQLGTF